MDPGYRLKRTRELIEIRRLARIRDYQDGYRDGLAGRFPDREMLSAEGEKVNHYERGYMDGCAELLRENPK